MKKLEFDMNTPTGSVIIDIPEYNLIKTLDYIANFTFHKKGAYEKHISNIENNRLNKDKVLIIIHDNSKHSYTKRCYIKILSKEDLLK